MRSQEDGEDWPVESFDSSPARYLMLALGFLGLCALGVGLASGYIVHINPWVPWREPGEGELYFYRVIGFVFLALGSFGAVVCGIYALRSGPAVSIGPLGIRDVRFADAWIPWSAIEDMEVLDIKSGISLVPVRGILLNVDPAFQRTLKLTRLARIALRTNAALGHPGLWIASAGLRGNFDELVATLEQGCARAKRV